MPSKPTQDTFDVLDLRNWAAMSNQRDQDQACTDLAWGTGEKLCATVAEAPWIKLLRSYLFSMAALISLLNWRLRLPKLPLVSPSQTILSTK